MGKVIAIAGQIASGKTTLAKFLETRGFERIVTYTTRPKREGEIDDVDYYFLSADEFEGRSKRGFFAEETSYEAKFGFVRYGTSKASLETPDGAKKAIVLNPTGVMTLKDAGYDIFVVYLDTPQEVLMRRALRRGDSPSEIGRRIADDARIFRRFENSAISGDYINLRVESGELLPNQIADWIQSTL